MRCLTVHISGGQIIDLQTVGKIPDSYTLIRIARSYDYYFVSPLHQTLRNIVHMHFYPAQIWYKKV
jgi:hypothetical protein